MILSGFRGRHQEFPSGTLLHFRKRNQKSSPRPVQKAFPAHSRREAEILQESGADLVLTPFAHVARKWAPLLLFQALGEDGKVHEWGFRGESLLL